MNYNNHVWTACIFSLLIFSTLFTGPLVSAQSDNFILEKEKHWDTYRVGGTCISGSHNLLVADIDGDNKIEIVTGGSTYSLLPNGDAAPREAPLRIWNWDNQNLTLEGNVNWPGTINCVYANDVEGDGKLELFISGSIRNETGTFSSLKVCNWDGSSLVLRASVEGVSTSDIFVKDVDKDGLQEILSVGRFNITEQYAGAKLYIWHLKENGLTLKDSAEWCVSNVTSASSVLADDLNGDGKVEIVTAGYAYWLKNSSGQIRVWQYNGTALTLKGNAEWRLKENVYALTIAGGVQGNTIVNSLKVGDVDGDGTLELVTGGFAFDGENVNAQLRIWNWNGENLSLETSKEWVSDYLTEVKSVSLNDFDGDSKIEIVTSGVVGAKGSFASSVAVPERAQLRVWSWDGKVLTLKNSKDWTIDDGACAWNVASNDVDGDGVVEIVNVGCTYFSSLCDPDMRIWSIQNEGSFPILYFAVAGALLFAVLCGVVLLARKWRR